MAAFSVDHVGFHEPGRSEIFHDEEKELPEGQSRLGYSEGPRHGIIRSGAIGLSDTAFQRLPTFLEAFDADQPLRAA